MPKTRAAASVGQKKKPSKFSFKLGGRKSAISALRLTTAELVERYESGNNRKDRNKIQKVLSDRGVKI